MTNTHPLTAAIAAARTNDLATLRLLVDWPLTGAGRMVRALVGVHEQARSRVLTSGLAELETAAGRPEVVDDALTLVVPLLAGGREIRRADPATAQAALGSLRLLPSPPGLTEPQRAALSALAARVAAVHEVLVVVGDAGAMPVALAADSGLLVLILPDEPIA